LHRAPDGRPAKAPGTELIEHRPVVRVLEEIDQIVMVLGGMAV
jgi:hypothetical protein